MSFMRPFFMPFFFQEPSAHYRLLGDPWTTKVSARKDVQQQAKGPDDIQQQQGGDSQEHGSNAQVQTQALDPSHPHDFLAPQDFFTHPAFPSPFSLMSPWTSSRPDGGFLWPFGSSVNNNNNSNIMNRNDLAASALSVFGPASSPFSGTAPWPKLDIHEQADKFTLSAELGGVPQDKVEVHIDELRRTLGVKGEVFREKAGDDTTSSSKDSQDTVPTKTKANDNVKSSRPVYTERVYGSFSRSLVLPENVDLRGIKARFDQGLLHVELPKITPDPPASAGKGKKDEDGKRQIKITGGVEGGSGEGEVQAGAGKTKA